MPTIIMTKWPVTLDGSVKAKAMTFLQKLSADDTAPGLHIEPINQVADPRVRTGRVDQSWRAVMFRLDTNGETHYVIHGVWPHDEAIRVAQKVRLRINPINGLPQIEQSPPVPPPPVTPGSAGWLADALPAPPPTSALPTPMVQPLLVRHGVRRDELVDRLGVPAAVAEEALKAVDEDEVLMVAQHYEGWLGMMLVDLAAGDSVESIADRLELERQPVATNDDAAIIRSLQKPAAQTQFAFIGDQEELRRVIDSGDFGAWRVFLHPDQRRYVERSYAGPFRLSGGAGTGKTVVLIHRARALARRDPGSRIVLTTFTTNLAESLRDGLAQLDSRTPTTRALGHPGVCAVGIDALAAAVIRGAGTGLDDAVRAVVGQSRSEVSRRSPGSRWRTALETTSTDLPATLANEAFLVSEYATVVIPSRVQTEAEYLRVRRPGRGSALDRRKRVQVWRLVDAYRAQARVDGSLDYVEAAAVAAAYLQGAGGTARPMADHVLVDEGQDLSPSHWQLLRALVAPGTDDLFIAEDSHQRIYGPPVVLGRYGIRIVGRSQRLKLNYRTTAQNLRYAIRVLENGSYVDLEDEAEQSEYRSARTGPAPSVVHASSITDELDVLADRLRSWSASDTPPETIAVLTPDRNQRDRLVTGLSERGVDVRAVDRESMQPGRPVVMTMHRAKGLEFAKVALAGVGSRAAATQSRLVSMDPAERADAELRERSLTYVAATRARDELLVIERP